MAAQVEEAATIPHSQVVANAFVEQYYTMLSHSPDMVHKFYQDSSVISRLDLNGAMSSVSTMEEIDKFILSMDYKNCVVQILTADAQDSFGCGVIVLVTGFVTRQEDDFKRKFTQVFFLAPQEKGGYFVLNDVLRYVDEEDTTNINVIDVGDIAPAPPETPLPEPDVSSNSVLDDVVIPLEDANQDTESSPVLDNGQIPSTEEEVVTDSVAGSKDDAPPAPVDTSENEAHTVPEAAVSNIQEDTPKKSYASVANALNFKKEPFQQRVLPAKPVEQRRMPVVRDARVASQPAPANGVEKKNTPASPAKGYSIFVANLPMDATVDQLVETFKKYGPIKPNGVQVRSYKQEKNCFGFVEFESADSMQRALEDSSVVIGNRNAHIEEKKTNNDGGKYNRRGGGGGAFRSESFKNRGRGGGVYGRNDSDNQARGPNGRNGEPNQKVQENGRERAARPSQPGSS